MNAKKISVALIAALAVHGSNAQIPVTDIAHITTSVTNQIEEMVKWAQQFKQMEQQINQYRQQYEAMTGPRGMATLLDNAAVKTALPADWQKVLTNIKTSATYINERKKYPTLAGSPKLTAMYDVIATQNASMSDLYTKANARLVQVQSLMGQIDSASDPAAKADLGNRLISEQNAIQANENLVAMLQTKQKQELDAASQAAMKEQMCKEFKRASC